MARKSNKISKLIKQLRKKLGLTKSKRLRTPSPKKSKTKKRISDFMQSSFLSTPVRTEKWREQIQDACFMYENVRVTQPKKVQELRYQSEIYRDEIVEMRTKIEQLQVERKRLSRALQTMEPIVRPSDSFLVYEQPSNLDLTPPPPMSPVTKLTPRKPSRDSAYYSSDGESRATSPQRNNLPKPKFDITSGKYMSNGYNTYFLAM